MKEMKVCPKCGSKDIKGTTNKGDLFGSGASSPSYECRDCGYFGLAVVNANSKDEAVLKDMAMIASKKIIEKGEPHWLSRVWIYALVALFVPISLPIMIGLWIALNYATGQTYLSYMWAYFISIPVTAVILAYWFAGRKQKKVKKR